MEYSKLITLVGEDWAEFLKPFMCPDENGKCQYDEISAFLKTQYDGGKTIFPDKSQVFRAFKETPLKDVRVVLLGVEPYYKPGFSNGLAYSTNATRPKLLDWIYDAIEKDVYNGIDFFKAKRTGLLGKPTEEDTIHTWTSQGVLLLNQSLTVEQDLPGSHYDIWRPFTSYIVSNLWRIKRDIIFIGWGAQAKELLNYRNENVNNGCVEGVNIFHAFVLTSEHPIDAAKGKRTWVTDNFSRTNLIIKCNGLGKPIEW